MKTLKTKLVYNRLKKFSGGPAGTALLQLRLHYNYKSKFVSTGIYLSPREWDGTKVVNRRDAIDLNLELNALETDALQFYKKRVSEKKEFLLDDLLYYLKNKGAETAGTLNFIDFTQSIIDEKRGAELSTIKQRKILLSYLRKFSPSLPFESLTYNFVKTFENWLLHQTSYRGGLLHRNYVACLLRIFRMFLNEAVRAGHITKNPMTGFRIKTVAVDTIYLTESEIEMFAAVKLPPSRTNLQLVKDVFLFSCFSSLRCSDLLGLKREPARGLRFSDLRQTPDGWHIIKRPKKTSKAGTVVDLPLHLLFAGKPEQILQKYLHRKSGNDLIFGQYEIASYNIELRKLAKLAGIKKAITSKTARHSFAVNCLSRGMNIYDLKQYMGHTSVVTTEKYSKLVKFDLHKRLKGIFN